MPVSIAHPIQKGKPIWKMYSKLQKDRPTDIARLAYINVIYL